MTWHPTLLLNYNGLSRAFADNHGILCRERVTLLKLNFFNSWSGTAHGMVFVVDLSGRHLCAAITTFSRYIFYAQFNPNSTL